MYLPDAPDTFWLDFTNYALGFATAACVLFVMAGVVWEITARLTRRKDPTAARALGVTGLGPNDR